jgi:hypothetical protein
VDAQRLHRSRPGTHQVAHGLVAAIRHPHRGELASAQEPGKGDRVTPVGLDPPRLACAGSATAQPLRNHGRAQ